MLLLVLTGVRSVLLAGGAINAAEDPQVKVVQTGELVKVIFVNSEVSDVRISMMDEQGERIFSERIKNQESFIRPYNLSNLEEGIYQIEIQHGNETLVGQIACVHKEPELQSNDLDFLAHVSKIARADQKERYLLTIPYTGKGMYTITIHNEVDDVLYKNTINPHGDFAQVYRIKDSVGNIVIQIADEDGKMMRYTPIKDVFRVP